MARSAARGRTSKAACPFTTNCARVVAAHTTEQQNQPRGLTVPCLREAEELLWSEAKLHTDALRLLQSCGRVDA